MKVFCLDTSALVESWCRLYPNDIPLFGIIWNQLDVWGKEGRIIAAEEVLVELEKNKDDLYRWAKGRRHIFQVLTTEVQEAVTDILKRHPRLVDTKRNRSIADPFVIAQAQISKAIVVSEENRSTGKSPKIPDVCDVMGIHCIRMIDLI